MKGSLGTPSSSAITRREEAGRAAIVLPMSILLALLTGSRTQSSLLPIKARPTKKSFVSEIIECFPFK
jgi:hypothetical protein